MASTAIRARRKGGRPSKGARHLFQSRVPLDLAEKVMQDAERSGMTYSDLIAVTLAEKYGHTLPAHYTKPAGDASVQEELQMQTAS